MFDGWKDEVEEFLTARKDRAEETYRERSRRKPRRINRVKPVLGVLMAAVMVVLIQYIIMDHIADKRAEQAYQQALDDAGPSRTILVDNELTVSEATLREVIAPASKLVTYEYYYSDVGTYEKSQTLFNTGIVLPFTTDKTLYTYSGVISVGVRLEKAEIQVDHEKKVVQVLLPQPEILSHQCDDENFKYYDVKKSVFTSSNLGDFKDFEAALKKTQEEKLGFNEEFWERARQNAKSIVSNLVTASEQTGDYTVFYEWF